MTTEDYVSYPIALALKKHGFDEPCRYYYNPKGMLRKAKDNALSPEVLNNRYLDEFADGVCSAVPLWQAQKWLREKHRISVRVNYLFGYCGWFADWLNLDSGEYDYVDSRYKSYERALSAGIAAALGLIEKKGE